MKYDKTAKDVFELWGRDYHADGMETEHWPRVRQMFDLAGLHKAWSILNPGGTRSE